MDVLELQKKANIAYGAKSIREDFLTVQSSSGAWNIDQKINIPKDVGSWSPSAITAGEEHRVSIPVWHRESGSVTQTILLDDEENQVQDLMFQIKTSLSIPHLEKIVKRLDTLLCDAKEEDSSSVGIDVGSLRTFYNFLLLHDNLNCPSISLTPDNNIYASWRDKQNRVFSVHFLPNLDTRFVIFKPNDKHPERKIRIYGTATIDILIETVSPSNELDWISE